MSEPLTKALFAAILKKETATALACIEQGAFMNRTIAGRGPKGESVKRVSALHLSAAFGLTAVVTALLEKGHAVDMANSLGWTALHEAAKAGHLDILKALHLRGCNLKATTKNGANMLHLAVINDHVEVGIYGLQETNNALLFVKDSQDDTPLHLATIFQRKAFLDYFLTYCYVKELLNSPGLDGHLPLHSQVTADPKSTLVGEFIDKGANPRLLNDQGERPSQLAQRFGEPSETLNQREFSLAYLCAKKIVEDPKLKEKAKKDASHLTEMLKQVEDELGITKGMNNLTI